MRGLPFKPCDQTWRGSRGRRRDPQAYGYQRHSINCPTCRKPAVLPIQEGVTSFPIAFHLNSLKEAYKLLLQQPKPSEESFSQSQAVVQCGDCNAAFSDVFVFCQECDKYFCKRCVATHKEITSHKMVMADDEESMLCFQHNKPLDVFCETCQMLVCRDCTIRHHRNCDHDAISDSHHKHHQRLNKLLKDLEKEINSDLLDIRAREMKVKSQDEVVKQEIHTMVQQIIDILQQSETRLTKAVEALTSNKLQVLAEQKKSAEANLDDYKDCKQLVEQTFESSTPREFLMSLSEMYQRVSQVSKIHYPNVRVEADVIFIKETTISNSVQYIGTVLTPDILRRCKIKPIKSHEVIIEKKMMSFPLKIELPNSLPLNVPLSSLHCNVLVATSYRPVFSNVTSTANPGIYKVVCNQVIQGSIQLNVQVSNCNIMHTTVTVSFNPYLDEITPTRTIDKINYPKGIAVKKDCNLVVSEHSSDSVILVSTSDNSRLRCGGTNFYYAFGVAVAVDDSIIVADCHRIQKMDSRTRSGMLQKSIIGKKGTKSEEFWEPHGVAISPTTSEIYVADYGNSRVCVLTANLNWSFTFGSKGSGQAQFNSPYDVAVDSKGHVYVADTYNHRIQKFTAIGEFICQFGTGGSGIGQFSYPYGITIDIYDMIYVSDGGNHRVSVFTSDGQFIRSFGSKGSGTGQFSSPHGLAFDSSGHLYVCDYYNKRIVVY